MLDRVLRVYLFFFFAEVGGTCVAVDQVIPYPKP